MDDLTLDEALEDLESAEDFLNYFGVVFDPAVVHVNRLHILQRYHNYLAQAGAMPESEAAQRDVYPQPAGSTPQAGLPASLDEATPSELTVLLSRASQ